MGLDLYLLQGTVEEINNGMNIELCYGRKTWVLADFFIERSEPIKEWLYRVPLSAWEEFMEILHSTKEFEDTEFKILLNRYAFTDTELYQVRNFVKLFGNEGCQLGDDWEARTIIRWGEADEEVRKAFKNSPSDIYLLVSY